MEGLLLTPEDIHELNEVVSLNTLPPQILAKLAEASKVLRSSHKIEKTKYTNVFVTSDIHGDLMKLDRMLSMAGLIERNPIKGSLTTLTKQITENIWIPERTLLVIVGDIVDSLRTADGQKVSQVPDLKGNIELILHAYLYNLRIRARLKNSEVLFTIGNHDYHTVILEDDTYHPILYEKYVHDSAKAFFGSRKGRRDCLMPFYNCCPYLMLDISSEIGFIHGGFLGYDNTTSKIMNNAKFVIKMQEKLDSANDFSILGKKEHDFLGRIDGDSGDGSEYSPLWSRAYAHFDKDIVCSNLDPFKMVVVGHCQMALGCGVSGNHSREILETEPYTRHNCGELNGCVVVGCPTPGGPKLAFVDIAFSRAFSGFFQKKNLSIDDEFARRAEMLQFTHDATLDISDRYFNIIRRVNTGQRSNQDNELVWAALPNENYEYVKTIKAILRYRALDFIRSSKYTYDIRNFWDFLDGLWDDIQAQLKAELKPAWVLRMTLLNLDTYIFKHLYDDAFNLEDHIIGQPTPLHFIAIDKNIAYLNAIFQSMTLKMDFLIRRLPPYSEAKEMYDQYAMLNLRQYENMDFFDIINYLIQKTSDPSEIANLFLMKMVFLKKVLVMQFGDRPEITGRLLEFRNPTPPTALHYAVVKKDDRLFDLILLEQPPLAWLDYVLPKQKDKFYANYASIIPEVYANKTARGIIDKFIDSEENEDRIDKLKEMKHRLLQLSVKPKTARTLKGLFQPTLARPNNTRHISAAWRRKLGVKAEGGTRKKKKHI